MLRLVLPLLAMVIASIQSIGQNITVSASLPAKTTKYQHFTLPITVSNTGIVDAEKFHLHLVLSADETYDPVNDKLITNDYVVLLEAGSSNDILLQTYSVDADAGTYNLLLVVDAYDDVVETDESDNILMTAGFIVEPAQIDLTFSSLDIPVNTAGIGDILEIDFSIANVGTSSTAGPIWTAFFLSNDNSHDASDIFIGSYHGFLTDEKTHTSAELLMPNVSPGNYFLIGKADGPTSADRLDYEMYTEPDEGNNFTTANISLSAPNIDLAAGNVDYAFIYQENPYNPFYAIDVSFTVGNMGITSAGSFTYQCYLSQEPFLDSYDQKIGFLESSYQRVDPGKTISLFAHSSGIFPHYQGKQYLLIHINPNNTIPETDITNNVLSYELEIPEPVYYYVDLTSATISEDVIAHDSQFVVNLLYINNSPGDYYNVDWITYSMTNSLGEQIPLQFTYPVLAVPQGGSQTYNHIVDVTGDLPAGTYTLTVRSSRNELSFPIMVKGGFVVDGTVQGEDGGKINAGKMFLYRRSAEGKYKYQNSISLAASNTFSFDINRDDHILYFIPDPALHPEYVPTIYDKALLIADGTVIKDSDRTLNFAVLKVNAIDPGGRVISGEVTLPEDEGGRLRNEVEEISVALCAAFLLEFICCTSTRGKERDAFA